MEKFKNLSTEHIELLNEFIELWARSLSYSNEAPERIESCYNAQNFLNRTIEADALSVYAVQLLYKALEVVQYED